MGVRRSHRHEDVVHARALGDDQIGFDEGRSKQVAYGVLQLTKPPVYVSCSSVLQVVGV